MRVVSGILGARTRSRNHSVNLQTRYNDDYQNQKREQSDAQSQSSSCWIQKVGNFAQDELYKNSRQSHSRGEGDCSYPLE